MFIAALFTIAKICKQPKCPSTDEWIMKMLCIYAMVYWLTIKKNEIMSFAVTWIDLVIIILNEVRKKQIPWYITYRWNKKYDTNELIYETNWLRH